MIKYLFVQISVIALPLIFGLNIHASKNNWGSTLPSKWFVGLFFLIIILTASISLGFSLEIIFSNAFALAIVSAITLLAMLTIKLCGTNRTKRLSTIEPKLNRRVDVSYEVIRLSIVLLLLLYGFTEVLRAPVNEWDAVFIWFNKAKSIYYGDLWHTIPFAEYPNSGPLVWAALMRLFGQTEQIGRLIFPTIYVFCCWQFSYVNYKSHVRLLYFLICWSVLSFYLFKNWTWNGYQDNFIACTAAMAVYLLIQCLNESDLAGVSYKTFISDRNFNNISSNRTFDSLAFLFCGMLYLIKNEGVALGSIICLTYFIYSNNKKIDKQFDRKKIAINMIYFFLPIVFQLLIKVTYDINPLQVQGDAFSLSTDFFIQERAMRLLPIGVAFGTYIWQNLFIYLLCLSSIYGSMKHYKNFEKNISINGFLITIIVLHSLFVVSVFIMTNQNLEWHLTTAFGRLMSQHLMIVFALTLWNLSIIINNFKADAEKTL